MSQDWVLREPLVFVPASSVLSPDSERLLDEVSDLLIHHPEVALLHIEHQADLSMGDPLLLEQQVIAVRENGSGVRPLTRVRRPEPPPHA